MEQNATLTKDKKGAINVSTFSQKIHSYLKHPFSLLVWIITILAALLTVASFVYLVLYILIKGVPYLRPELFSWTYDSNNVSMLPSIINTFLLTALSLVISVPLGIFAAIYMVEYAKKGNRMVKFIRVTAETLSGIPSIVYGLFGMIFFVGVLKMQLSLLSGSLTVAIMGGKFWTWSR